MAAGMGNRIVGFDGHIPILDSIYTESSTQKCPLGTRLALADGRVYRYAKNAASALAAGNLVQSAVPHVQFSTNFTASAGTAAGSKVLTAASTAGATSAAANLFADGFLGVAVGSGSGHLYQIRSHTAASSNSSFYITLYDGLKVAINSQSTLNMIENVYKDVIVHPASVPTGVTIGVTPMAITASYYFWLQTWGVATALSGANVATQGYCLSPNTQTAGALSSVGAATGTGIERILGQQIITSTNAGTQFVFLTISP